MPSRYAHLDPGHLAEYAACSLFGPETRKESVKLPDEKLDAHAQAIEFNGKGGTRTLGAALEINKLLMENGVEAPSIPPWPRICR
jgi:hypothetical protein